MASTQHRWRAVLAFLLLPSTAMGAPVEVGYLIARTPAHQGVADGTLITFTLHSDATCSDPAIRAVVIPLKDVTIRDVLREATRTTGRKPLNALRLVVKLDDVRADEAPFVRATGQGIFPAGVGCQMWYRPGLGSVHGTAAELRERMIPAGAAGAKPLGADVMPGTESSGKAQRP